MNPSLSSPRDFKALLCLGSQESVETATRQLAPLGFEVHTVSTPEQALSHWYSHFYEVMVVCDDFGGGDAQAHPVLSQLTTIPLDLRRKLFVVLVGPNLVSQSRMQAFTLSVDLVLCPQDLPNLKALVGQGLVQNGQFYAAFYEVENLLRKEA